MRSNLLHRQRLTDFHLHSHLSRPIRCRHRRPSSHPQRRRIDRRSIPRRRRSIPNCHPTFRPKHRTILNCRRFARRKALRASWLRRPMNHLSCSIHLTNRRSNQSCRH
jgi:hypothetical protein